jgi:FkbM family methyltransferase
MRRFIFDLALKCSSLPGGGRLMKLARSCCYAPYCKRMEDGVLYELDVFEWTQLEFAEGHYTEPHTVALIRRLLAPGDAVIDVGAHVGTLGLIARKCVGEKGIVISIEPQPYNCERLLKNWEINGFSNHVLYVAAAGPETGSIALPQQSSTDKARLSLALDMPNATALKFVVPIVTVASVIQQSKIEHIKLLKIDVEGFELAVMQGAESEIEKVENIIFEVLDVEKASSGLDEIVSWIRGHGFELFTVDGKEWKGELPVPESNLWASRVQAKGLR